MNSYYYSHDITSHTYIKAIVLRARKSNATLTEHDKPTTGPDEESHEGIDGEARAT